MALECLRIGSLKSSSQPSADASLTIKWFLEVYAS